MIGPNSKDRICLNPDCLDVRTHSALTIKTSEGIRNIERTPCMAERITEHPWTLKAFLVFKIGHES
ncbi:MAG: hypothetical protein ACNYVW_09535 [Methanosarcinales archaeon]